MKINKINEDVYPSSKKLDLMYWVAYDGKMLLNRHEITTLHDALHNMKAEILSIDNIDLKKLYFRIDLTSGISSITLKVLLSGSMGLAESEFEIDGNSSFAVQFANDFMDDIKDRAPSISPISSARAGKIFRKLIITDD